MDVLRKINRMRLDRGWSIYRLSVESGISQSTLTNMFNRETLPSITTLECLCNAFGVTVSAFFDDVSKDGASGADEQEVVMLYRQLSQEGKQGLLLLLRELAKSK